MGLIWDTKNLGKQINTCRSYIRINHDVRGMRSWSIYSRRIPGSPRRWKIGKRNKRSEGKERKQEDRNR